MAMFALSCLTLFQLFVRSNAAVDWVNESRDVSGVVDIPLDVFEIEAPLRASYDGTSCQQVIVQHDFANSFGSPFIGTYSPPAGCDFTTTIFNLSVTSAGINYDRLGLLYFGDIEIWRTTTAMPVRTGIFWNYQKDMTIFDTLLRSEQKVILELDNLFSPPFTGTYNVTITALYYDDAQTLSPADLILPISSQSSAQNTTSTFSVPDQNASVSFTIPTNAERAVISVLASGNGDEEFWYRNVPTEYIDTFNNTALLGFSPFREVQVLIDGQIAGVGWPFPVIFTGGISPGLWVPIVGIDTYDLPAFEVDISPFLALLCDGQAHTFQLVVVGFDPETTLGSIGENWFVSGAIFIWKDEGGNQTTGNTIQSITGDPTFQFTPNVTSTSGVNTTLDLRLSAQRHLSHTSTITTSSGSRNLSWVQELSYASHNKYTALGFNRSITALTNGIYEFSSSSSQNEISSNFSYPITFNSSSITPTDPQTTNNTLIASLDRSLLSASISPITYLTSQSPSSSLNTSTSSSPSPLVTLLQTRQNGTSLYFWNNTLYELAGAIDPAMGTTGATEQWFSQAGGGVVGYGRHVRAIDGYEPVLVEDEVFNSTIEVPRTDLSGLE